MKNNQKGFVGTTVLIVVALILIGGGVYYYAKHDSKVSTTSFEVSNKPEYNEENGAEANAKVTAYITLLEGNKITLDYFDTLIAEEAVETKILDGKCTREQADTIGCLPNGVYDRNVSSKLRTFTLSSDVKVTSASSFDKNPTGVAAISVQELKGRLGLPYEITLNENGEVTVIKEIFRP